MNLSPWEPRNVITLRAALDRTADSALKLAIEKVSAIFDPDISECVLTGNFHSVVFKNPSLKCSAQDNTPCTVESKIIVELVSKGSGLYEIVDYRHPQGCSTYEQGAPLEAVVKRLQVMCWRSRNR
jgi:hypothetical protein